MSTYFQKLKDPRWQKLRVEVFQRDQFKCVVCGDKKSTLHIHHLSYRQNPWESDPSDLETLCESCHEQRTKLDRKFKTLSSFTVITFFAPFFNIPFHVLCALSTTANKAHSTSRKECE